METRMSKYADQRANLQEETEEHIARIEARIDDLEKAFDERLRLLEAKENPDYLKEQFDDPIGQLEEIFNLGNYRREEE